MAEYQQAFYRCFDSEASRQDPLAQRQHSGQIPVRSSQSRCASSLNAAAIHGLIRPSLPAGVLSTLAKCYSRLAVRCRDTAGCTAVTAAKVTIRNRTSSFDHGGYIHAPNDICARLVVHNDREVCVRCAS